VFGADHAAGGVPSATAGLHRLLDDGAQSLCNGAGAVGYDALAHDREDPA
jgi:hypothetical protein